MMGENRSAAAESSPQLEVRRRRALPGETPGETGSGFAELPGAVRIAKGRLDRMAQPLGLAAGEALHGRAQVPQVPGE